MTVSTSFHVEILIPFFQVLFPFAKPTAWVLACMLHTRVIGGRRVR